MGLGGMEVAPEVAVARLEALGFTTLQRDAALVTVAVPPWRNDIAAPITLDIAPGLDPAREKAAREGCEATEAEADLVEEVLRLGGLDAVPAISLPVPFAVPPPAVDAKQRRAITARRILAARGCQDNVTYGFVAQATAEQFGGGEAALRLENPIAADLNQMRPTPVASLACAAAANAARGFADVALSEVGGGYRSATPDGQLAMACTLRAGSTPANWAAPARAVEALDAKADAQAVLEALGVPMAGVTITTDAPGHYHPGRSGTFRQGPKTVLAYFGEIHPQLRDTLGLPGAAVAAEVFLDAVPEPKRRKKSPPDLPAFQPLRRDLALLVDADVPADNLLRAARGAERALVSDVVLFDRYAGERLPEGKVSLAIQLTLQPRERTLTDAEIEAVVAKVVAAITKATGATLRG